MENEVQESSRKGDGCFFARKSEFKDKSRFEIDKAEECKNYLGRMTGTYRVATIQTFSSSSRAFQNIISSFFELLIFPKFSSFEPIQLFEPTFRAWLVFFNSIGSTGNRSLEQKGVGM